MIIINGRNVWPQDLEYLAEVQPEVISGGAAAFSIPGPDGEEKAALLIECLKLDKIQYAELEKRLNSVILMEHGIDCLIHEVPRNTIPRTTSGKLSRVRARHIFLEQVN
jgi:fatty-acyl-CoA synthase